MPEPRVIGGMFSLLCGIDGCYATTTSPCSHFTPQNSELGRLGVDMMIIVRKARDSHPTTPSHTWQGRRIPRKARTGGLGPLARRYFKRFEREMAKRRNTSEAELADTEMGNMKEPEPEWFSALRDRSLETPHTEPFENYSLVPEGAWPSSADAQGHDAEMQARRRAARRGSVGVVSSQ